MKTTDNTPQTFVVYRHFDSVGRLLYVGRSKNFLSRTHEHQRGSGWFHQVAQITVEHYTTEEAMNFAELEAIRTENPIWNKAENPNWESAQAHFLKIKNVFQNGFEIYADNYLDKSHNLLVEYMKKSQKNYRGTRLSSSWVALYFLEAIDAMLAVSDEVECDNCLGISEASVYNTWANYALDQLVKSGETEKVSARGWQ